MVFENHDVLHNFFLTKWLNDTIKPRILIQLFNTVHKFLWWGSMFPKNKKFVGKFVIFINFSQNQTGELISKYFFPFHT